MFRHAFEHEHQDCNLPYIFSESDKSFIESDLNENLLAQKDTIIPLITKRYISKDKKIVGILSDVLEENFDIVLNEIKQISEGQEKLLVGQECLQNQMSLGVEELIVRIEMINTTLSSINKVEDESELKKQLDETKKALATEKLARLESKRRRQKVIPKKENDYELDTFLSQQEENANQNNLGNF